ncbi:MAG TPA: hypothetical protein VFA46_08840 [Actinomycetes bacterium]|jgi:hypothetical protein|nr:hypothetical protein [Actinomycetes bacterium]
MNFSGVARYSQQRPDLEEMARARDSARRDAVARLRDFEIIAGATCVERSANDYIIYGPTGTLHVYRITAELV